MTGEPGGIEGLLGGPRRATILLLAFIVVAGVAIGALAYTVFSHRNSASAPQGAPATSYGQAAQAQLCHDPPQVDESAVALTRDGLSVAATLQTPCGSGDVVSGPAVQVAVYDGTRDVAAGIFDLSSTPIVISPGQQVQKQFVFPAGMYWRTPELVRGDTLTVELRNFTHLPSSQTSTSSGSALTAAKPADPAHGSAEGTATNTLKELSSADYPQVKNNLEDHWVPQISSKKLGLFADGITYSSVDILRNHLTLRQQYNDVRLVSSDDWTTFNGSDWWITVVDEASSDASSANRWCDVHGIDPFNCFAKKISATLSPDGTTVLRK